MISTTNVVFVQCTMRTLSSSNSSGLFALGHILKNHEKYTIELIFILAQKNAEEKKGTSDFRESHTLNFQILSKIYTVLYTEP